MKTTRIIYHNQLLFAKFGKNLRHIESMTSKVQPAENFFNRWRQNDVRNAARCRLLNHWPRKPGDKFVLYLVRGKTKSVMASFKEDIFWMNNKAIIEFGFRRIWRIAGQISEGVIHLGLRPLWIIPALICRVLHILRKPNSIIANYYSIRIHKSLKLHRFLEGLWSDQPKIETWQWSKTDY